MSESQVAQACVQFLIFLIWPAKLWGYKGVPPCMAWLMKGQEGSLVKTVSAQFIGDTTQTNAKI